MQPIRKISPQPNLYLSTPECDIWYNEDLKAVETKWKGIYCSGNKLKEILNVIIDLLILKKTSKVIADARNMKVISEPDRQWIVEDWYPRALKVGFRYEALIVSENTFNEFSIKKIVSEYDQLSLKTEYFSDFNTAADWIKKVSV